MRVLPGPTKSNQVLAWSPDGRFVAAAGSGDGVMVWDADGREPGQRVLSAGHGGEAMRFCPRTSRLYVAFRSGGFWSFDPDTGYEHPRRPTHSRVQYSCPAVSDDGQTVILRRHSYMTPPGEHAIVGFAVADDGSLTEAWARPDTTVIGFARFDFTFRPRTDQLFGLLGPSGGPREFLWTTATTGQVVGSFPLVTDTQPVTQWVLAPDGERVAWLCDRAIFVQRLGEPEPRMLSAVEGEYRRGLAWAPDCRMLAYCTGTTVRLLDADTFAESRAFDWGTGKPRAVCFSPDGFRAAVSADGGKGWVTVFDLE